MQFIKLAIKFVALGFMIPVIAADQKDVSYVDNPDGSTMGMGIYQPTSNPNRAAIVFIVSGGMRSGLEFQKRAESQFLYLVDAGFTVFAVRHTSRTNDINPQTFIPGIFNQVSLALEYISKNATDYAIDNNRIGILGSSSGGVLAHYLALTDKTSEGIDRYSRPKAAVIVSSNSELRGGGFPSLSAINLVSKDDPPVMLIHGDSDETIPFIESEKMYDVFKNMQVPTELVVLGDQGHNLTEEANQMKNNATLRWFTDYLID